MNSSLLNYCKIVLSVLLLGTLTNCSNTKTLSTTNSDITTASNKKSAPKKKKIALMDRMDLAIAQEVLQTKDPALGYVPTHRLYEAIEKIKKQDPTNRGTLAAIGGINWQERGPNNVGGRTRAVLIDKNDATGNTVWLGSVGGGLWKTTNATTNNYTHTPINDLFNNLAVTAIVQNPNTLNTMYFSTGEGFFNSDAIAGGGIWKSTDGGATWNKLTATNVVSNNSSFAYINELAIKEVGGIEYLFAATRTGLYMSNNGGTSFTKILGATVNGGVRNNCYEVELSANGDVYSALGESRTGDGVYKSTDNGTSFTKLTTGLPTTGFGRFEIACAPSDNNTVYTAVQNSSTNYCLGIYKSTDAGATWTAVANPGTTAGYWTNPQAWYNLTISVNPTDANKVLIAGLDIYNTTNGGTSWTQRSSWRSVGNQYVHADHHEIKYFTNGSGTTMAYFGNDGGFYFSPDANIAALTITEKNMGYNVTQFYHGAINPIEGSNNYLAGAQDNGTHAYNNAGINSTVRVTSGDGAFCHIDEDQPNIQISQYVYNDYFISNDGFGSYTNVEIGVSQGQFINPTDYDSRNNTLFGSYAADNYSLVTAVGTTNTTSTKALALLNGAKISAVTVSPNTLDLVFFGSTAGRVIKVDNASSAMPTATNITGNLSASGNISSIAVQEGNDNHILITISNFGVNSIHETTNGGTSWTSVEGNFTTDVPVRTIIFNPQNTDQALIGTDIGVYSTDDLNGTATVWGETNNGLARVSVHHLEYRKCDKTIIAVTHGRGVYTTSSLEIPIVKFDGSSTYKKEAASNNTTATCKPYVDVNVPVVLTKTANANATVSVTLGGTATQGKDYDIITPTPLSLSATGTTNVVVRIYNDTEIEPNETITLTLNVTNPLATNARLGCANTPYNITIISDDNTPSNYVKKYFTENWEGTPSGWTGIGGGTSASPNAWGILATCATTIENNTATIYNQFTNNCTYNNTITTNKVLYKQTSLPTGVTNPIINFEWTGFGEKSGTTNYDYGEIVYSTNTTAPTWTAVSGIPRLNNNNNKVYASYSLPTALIGTNFLIGFRWVSDPADGGPTSIGIDNIEITAQSPALVQTANNSLTANNIFVDANATVDFYDVSGNIMATLKNNNSTVLGCVKVEINRAGNTANVPFWNNNAANYVASKSIKISAPDAPATGVSYDVTAYYSQDEINTYTAGSGQPATSLSLLKIESPLSAVDITPATPNASSVTSAVATRTAYNTNDFAYTATFTSFSGFALGIAGVPLPLKFASFTGKALTGNNQLEWRTLYEYQSTGFELEKSVEGINFNSATTISSKGNTSVGHTYTYTDNAPYIKTYYRLKFVNELGQTQYSNIIELDQLASKMITVLPNPFTNKITVKYNEAVTGTIVYKLIDSKGSEVLTVQHNLQNQLLDNILQVQHLPKGMYTLVILKDGKTISKQIQKGE